MSSQDEALRRIADGMSDFRVEVSGALGTLVEGQKHIAETLANHKIRLDKQDEKIEGHTRDISQAAGGLKVTKWIGSLVAGAIAALQAIHVLKSGGH